MREVVLSVQKNGNTEKIVSKKASLGEVGDRSKRVRFNRFGDAREIDATITVTAPCRADLMAAVGEIEGER
jgi:hypothetical protein